MKFFVQVFYTQNPKRTKFEAKVGTFSGKISWSKYIKTDVVYFFSYHPLAEVHQELAQLKVHLKQTFWAYVEFAPLTLSDLGGGGWGFKLPAH